MTRLLRPVAALRARPELGLNVVFRLREHGCEHRDQSTEPRHAAKHAADRAHDLQREVVGIAEVYEEEESHERFEERQSEEDELCG